MRGHGCGGLAMSRTWRHKVALLVTTSVFFWASLACAQPAATDERVTVVNTSTVSGAGSCTGYDCVGAGVAQVKQNNKRRTLTIDNTGNAVAVGFCFGTCTASIGTGGTQYLAAGTVAFWPNGSAPSGQITFISASVTPPVTVREGL
jgi:hypothetical protein